MKKHSTQRIDKNCPIPNTHSRLEQAHHLWHQCLEQYFDPLGFKANLNSAIEALRNVTFMLQSEKKKIPDFDGWYSEIQQSLRDDPFASWISKARTKIVHKSDLQAESWSEAVIYNNFELATLKFKIDPFLPLKDSVSFSIANMPKNLIDQREFLVLSVEKKWVVNELPDLEILEVLGKIYAKLSKIVKDAHSRADYSYDTTTQKEQIVQEVFGKEGILPCMFNTQESRICRVSLKDGSLIRLKREQISVPTIGGEKVAKRYGWGNSVPQIFEGSPAKVAESLSIFAKKVLARDGHHLRMAFLHYPEGWHFIQIYAEDYQDKYVAMRKIAAEAKKIQADAIIEVAEVWLGTVSDFDRGIMPKDSKDRNEALSITLLRSNGEFKSYLTTFRRNLFRKVKFEETKVDFEGIPSNLSPLMALWGLKYPNNPKKQEN